MLNIILTPTNEMPIAKYYLSFPAKLIFCARGNGTEYVVYLKR